MWEGLGWRAARVLWDEGKLGFWRMGRNIGF